MGITGGLVRTVFSRSRSAGIHESNVRSNAVERKRWSFVRAYLCGDEFNSVLAKVDSASVKSSEATVTQPILVQQMQISTEEGRGRYTGGKAGFNHSIIAAPTSSHI
ncbi:hypothetical protein CJ030_MR3G011168 [Morella rubra]|uniref:Uncharacterized protein n=1 Tax=Morella rubra TaxID=262757 RepID=A0A6A1W2Z3_9ROSI|nr:hypothetical protein CJ030_MR3G011168 [Morella rubra]